MMYIMKQEHFLSQTCMVLKKMYIHLVAFLDIDKWLDTHNNYRITMVLKT